MTDASSSASADESAAFSKVESKVALKILKAKNEALAMAGSSSRHFSVEAKRIARALRAASSCRQGNGPS